jgi:hypothetical protein
MARRNTTITLDRDKVATVQAAVGAGSMSEAIDVALDRVIRADQLRRDVAAYAAAPLDTADQAIGDLTVTLDLGDDDVDYDLLYGGDR